ncbi:MAG TPA: DHA2 family efflux MFS transporter permease subunit [Acidimicrobiales bacterium]|nr:DHA2 family efflux MFS transporter permease subunit [Acidimicrobiales bacterium]
MVSTREVQPRPVPGAARAGGTVGTVGTGDEQAARRRWAVLAVLCLSLFIVSLDMTVLNVALPTIVRDMHATSSELQWIVDAYGIVMAGLILAVGSMSDRLGRKWVYLCGLVVFATGSATSAFCTTPDHLIGARCLMGLGAAAIMPSTLSILTNVFVDGRDRAKAIGIWSGTTGLGVAVGPVAGGWLLAHFWWGSVFLVNVPIALGGALAALALVPNSKDQHALRADPVGSALSIAAMGLLLWGIIEAPTDGWTSSSVLGALCGAAVVLAVFVTWEARSSHPMLRMAFFANHRFSVAISSMGFVIFALMGALFLLTQYLQFSLGLSALETGLRIMPVSLLLLVTALLSNVLVRRVGTKVVVFCGLGIVAVGFALLSAVTMADSYGNVLPALLCLGGGTGLVFAPCTDAIMGSLPLEQAGVGSATNGAVLQAGGALGVAILGSLLNGRYVARLRPVLAPFRIPAAVRHTITGSLGGALGVAQQIGGHLGSDLALAGRSAFLSGLDLAVSVGAIVVGVAALLVLATMPARAAPPPDEGAKDPATL